MNRRAVDYAVPVLMKTLDVLECLQRSRKSLTLEAVCRHTGISKSTVFRILKTLVHRGYVHQGNDGAFQASLTRRKIRIAFISEATPRLRTKEIEASLRSAATMFGLEIIVCICSSDHSIACLVDDLRNNEVSIVIEHIRSVRLALGLGDMLSSTGIPLLSVDRPHPRAIYCGPDYYRIGRESGKILASYGHSAWGAGPDWVLAVQDYDTPATHGYIAALQQCFPDLPHERYVSRTILGDHESTPTFLRNVFDHIYCEKRVFIALFSSGVDGQLLQLASEFSHCGGRVVLVQSGESDPDSAKHLNDDVTIAFVACKPAAYGPIILEVALAVLHGQAVSPYHYVPYTITSRQN